MRFWYRVCFVIARVGLFFWHPVLHVSGLENLPAGAAVLCANHSSGADAIWVILALRQPELFRIMAKSELRRVPFVGWVMEKFRIIFDEHERLRFGKPAARRQYRRRRAIRCRKMRVFHQ